MTFPPVFTDSSLQPSSFISCVAQEVMLRNNSGSPHLLAVELRARNIISSQRQTPVRPPRRRITIADNWPATASISPSVCWQHLSQGPLVRQADYSPKRIAAAEQTLP